MLPLVELVGHRDFETSQRQSAVAVHVQRSTSNSLTSLLPSSSLPPKTEPISCCAPKSNRIMEPPALRASSQPTKWIRLQEPAIVSVAPSESEAEADHSHKLACMSCNIQNIVPTSLGINALATEARNSQPHKIITPQLDFLNIVSPPQVFWGLDNL